MYNINKYSLTRWSILKYWVAWDHSGMKLNNRRRILSLLALHKLLISVTAVWIIPRKRVFFPQIIVASLLKEFPRPFWTRIPIAVFTSGQYYSVLWARWIQPTNQNTDSSMSSFFNLLSYYLGLGFPLHLIYVCIQNKIVGNILQGCMLHAPFIRYRSLGYLKNIFQKIRKLQLNIKLGDIILQRKFPVEHRIGVCLFTGIILNTLRA